METAADQTDHLAAILALFFLRGVGIVGHSKQSLAQDEQRQLRKDKGAIESPNAKYVDRR